MPFYAYRCLGCQEETSIFHSIKEKKERCDSCDAVLERIIEGFSFVKKDKNLKGANSLLEKEKNQIKEATEEIKRERIKDFKI
jgi:putative FmdB family regulatory protein